MLTEQPLVSVIMNCYNSEKYLREAIQSVLDQTYQNFEIIFWDNQSTDHSADIVRSFDEARIKYFYAPEHTKLGEARNEAIKMSRGDFVAFLDCDDLWMPQKLEKQIPLFDDSEVGLVYSDVFYFNEDGQSQRLYETRPAYTGKCFSALITDYCVCMQTVVVRRKALEDLSYWFDTRFEMSEERDLFTRIGHQWKYAMVNEPLAKWRVHSASSSWTKGHLFADEIDMMLKKYNEIIPDFEKTYARELSILQKKNTINKAMCYWRQGSGQAARRVLVPWLSKCIKAWLVIGATFFPESLLRKLLSPLRQTKILPKSSS